MNELNLNWKSKISECKFIEAISYSVDDDDDINC